MALTDLARQQPIPAHVESAILRLLAHTPGLINHGSVIDRAGRPGVLRLLASALRLKNVRSAVPLRTPAERPLVDPVRDAGFVR
jgi:hypothetical protein